MAREPVLVLASSGPVRGRGSRPAFVGRAVFSGGGSAGWVPGAVGAGVPRGPRRPRLRGECS